MADVRGGSDLETAVAGERTEPTVSPGAAATPACRCPLDPAPDDVDEGRRVTWSATVAPGSRSRVRLTFAADGTPALGPGGPAPWGEVAVDAPDIRLPRLVRQSLADLGGLLMKDGDDAFVAAGAPWFLTLFGRDSLWVARLLMPYGTDLALSTLRTLARRQGTKVDPDSEEQPGKILARGPQHHPRARRDEPAAGLLRHRRRDPAVRVHAGRRLAVGRRPRAGRRAAARRAPLPGVGDGAVARSPAGCATSTCPGAAWPTRAGRTASTRCSSPTAGWPTRRSR